MAELKGADLKTFTESLLDGDSINETYFLQLANIAKTKIEDFRDWKKLQADDTSQTANASDTFLTTKSLPSDYATITSIELLDSGNISIRYSPIPFKDRYVSKDSSNLYYIDHANNTLGLTGNLSDSRTIKITYQKTSDDITLSTAWVFPQRFHPLLGFLIAEMVKAGSDYDRVNVGMALQHREDAKILWNAMQDWDNRLSLREQGGSYQGQEYTDSDGLPVGEVVGTIKLGDM